MRSNVFSPSRLIDRTGIFLSVLALIAVYALKGIWWISWDTKCQHARNEMRALGLALKMFEEQNQRLPTTSEGLKALEVCPPSLETAGTWQKLVDTTACDFWGQPYQYFRDRRLSGGYGIYSFGQDRSSDSRGNDPDDLCTWEPDRVIPSPPSPKLAAAEIIAWVLLAGCLFSRWRNHFLRP